MTMDDSFDLASQLALVFQRGAITGLQRPPADSPNLTN